MLVMTDTDLRVDVLQLLHGEQDMHFRLPVVPGDIITCIATIQHIEEKASGESLGVEVQSTNQRGELVQTMLFSAFIRNNMGKKKMTRRGKSDEAFSSSPKEEPLVRISQSIDTDQTYRYAKASGDHNPIHVDENVAKMAGMPGIIVHGLCTMAFTSKVMIDHLCNHDPGRLHRLRARFARPVFPGQEITTAVWKQSEPSEHTGIQGYTYETYNPDGKAVIKDGIAEIRAA
jgi:acyl dehydratase